MDIEGLADGWEVWSVEPTRVVLTYRPDVFDTTDFPAACLPTIHVRKGKRGRRPGRHDPDPYDPWYVTLYLEPEVHDGGIEYENQSEARRAALELATEFARGGIDYRGLYQVPRTSYLDRLDELTGQG